MELQGAVIKIGDIETFGAKGFKKRQLVIKTDSQYPQSIPIDFTQDKCVLLNSYKIGDFVEVGVNVQGTEWNSKYYVNLNGWKITSAKSEVTSDSFMPDRKTIVDNGSDDLPF